MASVTSSWSPLMLTCIPFLLVAVESGRAREASLRITVTCPGFLSIDPNHSGAVKQVWRVLHQTLTLAGWRDAERLAVLGHGAARHLDALILQQAGDLAVAERLAHVFRGHQLLDDGADGGGGTFAALDRAHVAGEEILQLEDAARRVHVFLGGEDRKSTRLNSSHVK